MSRKRPVPVAPSGIAVIYARYSSSSQREESIEDQLRECRRWADQHGLTIVGEYCDHAISGRSDARPQFQRMIADAEAGLFSSVILYKTDRFARNRVDSAVYKQRLKRAGVSVYYAKESIPDGPEGIILESLMEGLAEYYSANLSQNIRRGQEGNALKGKALGGPPPLGLRVTTDRKYEPDPLTAPHVLRAYHIIDDGGSNKDVMEYLNGLGLRTSKGKPFAYSAIPRLLSNRKYIGEYRWQDIVIQDAIPPIVPHDLFDRVQLRLTSRQHTKGGQGRAMDEYLLTSKLFCGHCGSPMIGDSGTSKSGTVHHYYTCSCRKRQRSCDKAVERKSPLETLVVRHAVEHVLQPDVIRLISDRAIEIYQAELRDDPVAQTLESELKSINTALSNLLRAIEMGIITPTTQARMRELESQKAEHSARLSRHRMSRPPLTRDHIEFFLSSMAGGDVSDPAYCRQIIDAFVRKVVITDLPGTPDTPNRRKILIQCNLSHHDTVSVECSDALPSAPPIASHPNIRLYIRSGCVELLINTAAPV